MFDENPANAEPAGAQATGSGAFDNNEDTGTPKPAETQTDVNEIEETLDEGDEVKDEEDKQTKKKEEKKNKKDEADNKQTKKKETTQNKTAQEKRQEIVDSYVERMKDPDFDISKVPDWVINSLGLNDGAKLAEETKNLDETEDKGDDFETKMEKYEAKKQFKKDKDFLQDLPLPLRNKLVSEANTLKKDVDIPISKALRHVIQTNSEEIDKELGHLSNRRNGAALPRPGKSVRKGEITEAVLAKMSQKEYNETMEKVNKGELKISTEQ